MTPPHLRDFHTDDWQFDSIEEVSEFCADNDITTDEVMALLLLAIATEAGKGGEEVATRTLGASRGPRTPDAIIRAVMDKLQMQLNLLGLALSCHRDLEQQENLHG